MEQKDEIVFHVKRNRSYVACITQGVSVSFRHLGQLVKYVWPSLLLSSVFTIPFIVFFAGQVDAILRKWTDLGYLPKVKPASLKKEILHCTLRNTISFCILIVFFLMIAACVVLSIYFGLPIWCACLILLLGFFLFIPVDVCFMYLSYTDEPVLTCLKSIKIGFCNYSRLFAFEFLLYLFYTIISLLSCLPFLVVLFVCIQANNAMNNGDVIDLPTLFPFYALLAYVACVAAELICLMMCSFCQCLMWGSLVEEIPADTEVNC